MHVVADTGPLNYLLLIERIDILPCLFGEIIIPADVADELRNPLAPPSVRAWIAAPPGWLRAYPRTVIDVPSKVFALDDGERAVIMLALSLDAGLVLMDERAGVAAARGQGLAVTGTLGILDLAARSGLIDFPLSIAALRATNFHMHKSLPDRLLAEQRQREG